MRLLANILVILAALRSYFHQFISSMYLTFCFAKELYILTGMETFAKEPELTTMLRRQNLTPVSRNKIKFAGFCRMSVTSSLLRFGCFAEG